MQHPLESQVIILSQRNASLEAIVRDLAARLNRAEIGIQQVAAATGGGTGKDTPLYWCKLPSAISAATGSFPSITPTSFTADVYQNQPSGGTPALVKVATAATCYWWYKDAGSSGKLCPLSKNVDGSYDAHLDSCTSV